MFPGIFQCSYYIYNKKGMHTAGEEETQWSFDSMFKTKDIEAVLKISNIAEFSCNIQCIISPQLHEGGMKVV